MTIFGMETWSLFIVTITTALIATYLMSKQGKYFFTIDVVKRKFSILDLEFASNERELHNIISGIYLLPEEESRVVISKLKGQLKVDTFLFIPAIYASIFLLCIGVTNHLSPVGVTAFTIAAYAQALPLILDVVENIYLLYKIRPGAVQSSAATHKMLKWLEIFKWGISCISGFGGLAILCSVWLTGDYMETHLKYVSLFLLIIIVYAIISFIGGKPKNEVQG